MDDNGDDGMDDNGDDGHDEMWTFHREMSECDYDADGMVDFDELDACVTNDLANDGYGNEGVDGLQWMFDLVDADEDGMLDSDEFNDFAEMTSGEPMMVCYDRYADEIDSSITSEEECEAADFNWIQALQPVNEGDDGMDDDSSGVSESELFAAADSDNDGLVTTSDIVDAVLSMDAPTPQDALDQGDIDQSDNISWDEFVQLWNMEEDENDADDQHLNNNPQLESDLHAAFNGSDSDYDGNLSIDELQSFIDDVTTISSTQEEITEMITIFTPYVACVDSNSDGSLDQVEFSDFYGAVMYGMENTELVFCTVDSNQDGIVTVSEYVDLINQTGMYSEENPMTEQDWEGFTSLFGIYDTDGIDGLSLTEYQSMMEDISPGGDDSGTFICENGGEVPASFVDDGYNDCGDWSDEPNHSNNGDGGHGDHGSMFDWMISNSQDMPMEGSFDDYTIVLAMCTIDESSDDGMDMGMGTTPAMNCDDDVLSVTIADAMAQDAVVMFHDADMSGTISGGDMVHISPDIDVDGDWNMVRLYSTSADAYSDENPMLTPGFTGALGMLALLGAALLTRRD
jgi:Ca2+-binding EF-hand superfamily protein